MKNRLKVLRAERDWMTGIAAEFESGQLEWLDAFSATESVQETVHDDRYAGMTSP